MGGRSSQRSHRQRPSATELISTRNEAVVRSYITTHSFSWKRVNFVAIGVVRHISTLHPSHQVIELVSRLQIKLVILLTLSSCVFFLMPSGAFSTTVCSPRLFIYSTVCHLLPTRLRPQCKIISVLLMSTFVNFLPVCCDDLFAWLLS